jgi:hypothetical protein
VTRNRFPAWWERVFIDMHGDNLQLTHHLLPGIPHWNLQKAHRILTRDECHAAANGQADGIISREEYRGGNLKAGRSRLKGNIMSSSRWFVNVNVHLLGFAFTASAMREAMRRPISAGKLPWRLMSRYGACDYPVAAAASMRRRTGRSTKQLLPSRR